MRICTTCSSKAPGHNVRRLAAALTLLHPLTGETVKAAAPVPEDMLCVLPPGLRALLAGLQP